MRSEVVVNIEGLEYDWLACDKAGCVALFSTAGVGYAPRAFIKDIAKYDSAIDLLLKLKPMTSAKFFPDLAPKLDNTWKKVAERGLFAFDADLCSCNYKCVSAPENPVQVESLPKEISKIVKQIRLEQTHFCMSGYITKQKIQSSEIESLKQGSIVTDN